MNIGVQLLAYNQEEYIGYCMKALYPYVDVIQIMYSESPFTAYNRSSREEFFKIDKTAEILYTFPDTERKINICSGQWADEESMRNSASVHLMNRGVKLMLIIDCDEFWPDCLLPECIGYLTSHLPNDSVAWAKCKTPFKRLDRLVDFEKARLPVAVWLSEGIEFIDRRVPVGEKCKLPDYLFFWHLGYILSDTRMYEKIKTFSHAHEVPDNWYQEKWLNFSSTTSNLCRKTPERWPRTIKMNPWDLPSILYTHPFFPYGASGL